jgi:hypothetical protein
MEETEVRAMILRDYLVEHFGFDDSKLKTLGLGRQAAQGSEPGEGAIQLLIFPVGSEEPNKKQTPAGIASKISVESPVRAPSVEAIKP